MFYYLIFVFYLIFQSLLISTTNIYIYPEFLVYPWLITKGLLPYKDFSFQHGVFLYSLLAPFSIDKSLTVMKIFYIGLQTINLFLVLKILKKNTNKLGFIIAGGLFILLNYYASENNLWDDNIVLLFYLLIYFILIRNKKLNRYYLFLIGFLTGLVTFIKPTFGLILIPVILFSRNFIPLLAVTVFWLLMLIFFFLTKSLNYFLDNYIFYNLYYASGLIMHKFFVDPIFFRNLLLITILSLLFYFLNRKNFLKNPIFSFLIISFILFLPGFRNVDLPIFIAFLSIFIGQLLFKLKKLSLCIFITVLFFFGIFLARQVKHAYFIRYKQRTPYMEKPETKRIVNSIKNFDLKNKNIYIFGNYVELYYFLDKIPPTRYNLLYQNSFIYYKNIEELILNDIKKNKVNFVVAMKPLDQNYKKLNKLRLYIVSNYKAIYEDRDFELLSK